MADLPYPPQGQLAEWLSSYSGRYETIDSDLQRLLSTESTDQGVLPLAIILTDGASSIPMLTMMEAKKARDAGITILAVGVKGADEEELLRIAGDSDRIFSVRQYSQLRDVERQISKTTCKKIVPKPTSPPPTVAVTVCQEKQKADIMFVLDAGKSVNKTERTEAIAFVKDVTEKFSVAQDLVNVGLMTYSSRVVIPIPLRTYTTSTAVIRAILQLEKGKCWTRGSTNTAKAIQVLREHVFKLSQRRKGAPRFAIVVTDGKSDDRQATLKQAALARQEGITLVAVGVSGADKQELLGIAGYSEYVYTVQTYSELTRIEQQLTERTCTDMKKQADEKPIKEYCKAVQQADLYVLLDSSGSLGISRYRQLLNFLKDVVDKLDIGADKVRVGLIRFSFRVRKRIDLGRFNDKETLKRAIDKAGYEGMITYTHKALKMARQEFVRRKSERKGIPQLVMVVTDGQSTKPQDTLKEADLLRKAGIIPFAVGVKNANLEELKGIAGDSHRVMYIQDFDQLKVMEDQISGTVCKYAQKKTVA